MYAIIIADEAGRELPAGEEGQIAVRMDTDAFNGIFREYVGDPEKGAEVFRNGLYYTGDKAYRDDDGYIWFVGRNDDVIKSSDYRVGPFEVESVLMELDEVLESAVVGSPHPVKGQEVKAFIVLTPEAGGSAGPELAERIFTYARSHMAPFKMPRIIEFVTALPKTISGKIRRLELRAMEAQSKVRGEEREGEYFYRRQ
jgi:acetyl-CoA synthetase